MTKPLKFKHAHLIGRFAMLAVRDFWEDPKDLRSALNKVVIPFVEKWARFNQERALEIATDLDDWRGTPEEKRNWWTSIPPITRAIVDHCMDIIRSEAV